MLHNDDIEGIGIQDVESLYSGCYVNAKGIELKAIILNGLRMHFDRLTK